jgi:hypothetical protein
MNHEQRCMQEQYKYSVSSYQILSNINIAIDGMRNSKSVCRCDGQIATDQRDLDRCPELH